MRKRLFDVLVASLLLLLLFPCLVTIACLIRCNMGKPIFFSQSRPGQNGRTFNLYKFRTMRNTAGIELEDDAKRLTKFGQFLRKTSFDEWPELWNVLKGEMSLVGPRPLLTEYLGLYNQEQKRRHHVRPGITGLAQIKGRNTLSWEDKFKLDVWYVDNYSFWLDIKILCLTVLKVLKREGITDGRHATVEKFKGASLDR